MPDHATEFDWELREDLEGSAVLGLGSCSHCKQLKLRGWVGNLEVFL